MAGSRHATMGVKPIIEHGIVFYRFNESGQYDANIGPCRAWLACYRPNAFQRTRTSRTAERCRLTQKGRRDGVT